MSLYAEVTNGTCTNVVVCDDQAHATAMGWIGPIDTMTPQPALGWEYANGTWSPPPPPPPTAADTARSNLQDLLAQQSAFASQIQTDAAMFQGTAVGSTLQQEHIDALVRMVNGFATTMGAIVDHLTVNGIT